MHFYSNGKLLLTGEYLVLDGAKAFAVPTKKGQDLKVLHLSETELVWESYTVDEKSWFKAVFDLKKMRLKTATFPSNQEGSSEFLAETLLDILKEAKALNPKFLETNHGFFVTTKLSFPRDWGLGSSSTLINSIADWAKVDAFTLLWNSFKGSGYDIACAQNDTPLFYQIHEQKPKIEPIVFQPDFLENLFFIHLNKKQDSKQGIADYRKNVKNTEQLVKEISSLSEAFVNATSILDLEKIMISHEEIIGKTIQRSPVKEVLFPDYFGAIKSLGAWGGDFILATGNEKTKSYFVDKGYTTVLTYKEMVL